MTATIQRRVEALESAGAGGVEFILILRRIVTPALSPGEATHARALGQSFTRERTETEAQFIERIRASALACRRTGQHSVQVLLEETDIRL